MSNSCELWTKVNEKMGTTKRCPHIDDCIGTECNYFGLGPGNYDSPEDVAQIVALINWENMMDSEVKSYVKRYFALLRL